MMNYLLLRLDIIPVLQRDEDKQAAPNHILLSMTEIIKNGNYCFVNMAVDDCNRLQSRMVFVNTINKPMGSIDGNEFVCCLV